MSVYIIAEAGVNHNGDIELAKKLVKLAAESGADAVKFQTFKKNECTSKYADKAEYQKNNSDGSTQYEMISQLELPFSDFKILKEYAESLNIDFISTPDGSESLNCLVDLELPVIKISSTDVTNHQFLKEIGLTQKKIILSTGMSNLAEIEEAVDVIKSTGNENIILMHCTTSYPTMIDDVNIRAMETMKNAFKLPVGYSDHTLSSEAAIAAVTLGACYIEKHITLSKELPGPDHKASMNPDEFKNYVSSIRNTEKLLGNGIKKPTETEKQIMKDVRRSILAKRDLCKGTIITEEMLCFKRPGDGIEPKYIDKIIGLKINRDIKEEEKIQWEDFK